MVKRTDSFSREGYLYENYHYFHLRDTAGQERDFHFHEFDKAVILLSGRVDYLMESGVCALSPGDVLLVRHHAIHKALIDQTQPYERAILYLDRKYFERIMTEAGLMECFDNADRKGKYLFTPSDGQSEQLQLALSDYERALEETEVGAQVMRDTRMIQLLVLLNRICVVDTAVGTGESERRDRQTDPKIEKVLSYINENFTRDLSVDELAALVYLSRYHFMRLFKEQTGSTVYAYVRQKRLLYAARLIREGMSAENAAAACGFKDYSGFHRAFKTCFGISPGMFKKSGGNT
ncbi:MAG: AraC family transcriptional regulator [Lachnospiraceae bacterium]|nr:AraC family transcriptional regulator [Lachnospiraceae bacterium]